MPSEQLHKVTEAGGIAPGIVTFVFGKRGYYQAAEFLAITLKEHSPGVPLTVYAERPDYIDHSLFAHVEQLRPEWIEGGPGSMKVRVYDILPNGEWLYMDVDSLVNRDITPFLADLQRYDFLLEVMARGTDDKAMGYFPWATTDTINKLHGLPVDTLHYAVQSSWMWIRKPSDLAFRVFKHAQNTHYTQQNLKERWGNDIPDELRFSTALAILQPDLPTVKLSFYGGAHSSKGLSAVAEPILCLYGDHHKRRLVRPSWLSTYDRYLRTIYQRHRRPMMMSIHRVMRDKYVNQ